MLSAMTPDLNGHNARALILLASFFLGCTASFFAAQNISRNVSTIPIPDAMRRYLERHSDYHILSLDDVATFWRADFESGRNKFQPVATGDANNDGKADTCAVLVSDSHKYSVACFQGSEEPVWVWQDDPEQVLGVAILPGMVTPIFCYYCDAGQPLRWSGIEYELGIRLPTERVCINPRSKVMEQPDISSPVLFTEGEDFGYVEVLTLGEKTPTNTRWQQVRLLDPKTAQLLREMKPKSPSIVGWMDSKDFFNEVGC